MLQLANEHCDKFVCHLSTWRDQSGSPNVRKHAFPSVLERRTALTAAECNRRRRQLSLRYGHRYRVPTANTRTGAIPTTNTRTGAIPTANTKKMTVPLPSVHGCVVGAIDGGDDGAEPLGGRDGAGVGASVGLAVGAGVGVADGVPVGAGDGLGLGTCEGAAVGTAVGAAVGAEEGDAVGLGVGAPVGPAVGAAVGAAVTATHVCAAPVAAAVSGVAYGGRHGAAPVAAVRARVLRRRRRRRGRRHGAARRAGRRPRWRLRRASGGRRGGARAGPRRRRAGRRLRWAPRRRPRRGRSGRSRGSVGGCARWARCRRAAGARGGRSRGRCRRGATWQSKFIQSPIFPKQRGQAVCPQGSRHNHDREQLSSQGCPALLCTALPCFAKAVRLGRVGQRMRYDTVQYRRDGVGWGNMPTKTNRTDPIRSDPIRSDPFRRDATRSDPNQIKPNKTKPNHKLNKNVPNRMGREGLIGAGGGAEPARGMRISCVAGGSAGAACHLCVCLSACPQFSAENAGFFEPGIPLVSVVWTPLRALSKRRERRCNAPAPHFPTSDSRFRLRRFANPIDGPLAAWGPGPWGWGGHAGLPKVTTPDTKKTGMTSRIWQDRTPIFPTPPEFCSLARDQLLTTTMGSGAVHRPGKNHITGQKIENDKSYLARSHSDLSNAATFLQCGSESASNDMPAPRPRHCPVTPGAWGSPTGGLGRSNWPGKNHLTGYKKRTNDKSIEDFVSTIRIVKPPLWRESLGPGTAPLEGLERSTGLAKITVPDTGIENDKSYLARSHSDLSNAARILQFGSASACIVIRDTTCIFVGTWGGRLAKFTLPDTKTRRKRQVVFGKIAPPIFPTSPKCRSSARNQLLTIEDFVSTIRNVKPPLWRGSLGLGTCTLADRNPKKSPQACGEAGKDAHRLYRWGGPGPGAGQGAHSDYYFWGPCIRGAHSDYYFLGFWSPVPGTWAWARRWCGMVVWCGSVACAAVWEKLGEMTPQHSGPIRYPPPPYSDSLEGIANSL
eukprot:gene5088-biopygen1073